MEIRSTSIDLWPTRVTFFETPVDWVVNRQLADEAIAAVEATGSGSMANAAKRRVRGILEKSAAGHSLKVHLFDCARAVLGPWAKYLDPDHCENRALVIEPGGFTEDGKRAWKECCVTEHMFGGPTLPCNWIEITEDGLAAFLKGTDPGKIVGRGSE